MAAVGLVDSGDAMESASPQSRVVVRAERCAPGAGAHDPLPHQALYDAPYHPAAGKPASMTHSAIPSEGRHAGQFVEPEEFSKLDLTHACWQFIHQSIDASLASEHPLVQALAILDRRVGRGRFEKFVEMDRDPLPAYFAELRRLAEAGRRPFPLPRGLPPSQAFPAR